MTPDSISPWSVHRRISTRARRLRVEVRRDGSVWLIVPRHASPREARAFLADHHEWIEHIRQRMATRRAADQRLALAWDGNDHLPLQGKALPLQRIASRIDRPRVRLLDHRIEVLAPPGTPTAPLERALTAALREQARALAAQLLNAEAGRLRVSFIGPRIADPRSRWGSCAASGLISLSWRLVLAPQEVLRYVVVHELCHRVHANHSAHFWALVGRQLPGFETPRAWLRQYGTQLHAILPRRPP